MLLNVTYPVLPKRNSVRASLVMDHFGISHDTSEHVLARDLEVPLQPGDVVLFTGASGSGKSSLLKAVLRQLDEASQSIGGDSPRRHRGTEKTGAEASVVQPQSPHSPIGLTQLEDSSSVPPCLRGESHSADARTLPVAQYSTLNPQRPLLLDLPSLPLGTHTLVDAIPLPFDEALQLLAMCGLGEAPLLLRTPQELSEGQRYRFSLALAVALKPQWIIADEFTAVLDRTTAKVIAYNVRRIADRYGVGFLLATAQHDIAADLSPDLCVTCDLDGRVIVTRQTASGSPLPLREGLRVRTELPDDVSLLAISSKSPVECDSLVAPATSKKSPTPGRAIGPALQRKKKAPPFPSTATSGSAPPPVATGRISLGGIIAVTTSG